MIYLLCVLLNVPASPAVTVQAPIPRSGFVHGARSGHVAKQLQDRDYWDAGLAARSLFLLSATKLWPPSPLTISNSPVASKSAGKFLAP